ncbi:MAG: V-type ATP synthase subunit D [Candidatus Thermoplasmatota archaeon]|nr:V-type ATP synthase subunit D [Candidatus Thermoplasmatota archaeon]
MSQQLLEGVKPTRMELLEIRKKLTLAEKGHKLLEEKRDALVERFFSVIDTRNALLLEIDSLFKEAFTSLMTAQMIIGEEQVKQAAYSMPQASSITFTQDNIMGVKIPKISMESFEIPEKISYTLFDTCAALDEAQVLFSTILKKLITLADVEGGIKSLSVDIEKTKRRVHVLENNLIPRLQATRKYIEMQLEELEREDFFRRKRIKAIMESKKQSV